MLQLFHWHAILLRSLPRGISIPEAGTKPTPERKPRPRSDGSATPYWQPEVSYENVQGWKAHVKWEDHIVDPNSTDVLDVAAPEISLQIWEREILDGKRNPVHKEIIPDRRHHRQYKVHEFPSGKFVEICGNLVRLNYKPMTYIPSSFIHESGGRFPKIVEGHPENAQNYILGEGTWGKFKDLMHDLKELGPRAWWNKVYNTRKAWYRKEGKVLIGIDRFGNKYWEAARAHKFCSTRWVEYANGMHQSYAQDIPWEWYRWIRYIVMNPPNDPDEYPIWFQEYWHSRDRWIGHLREEWPEGSIAYFDNAESRTLGAGHEWNRIYEWDPDDEQGGRRYEPPKYSRHTWVQ